MTDLTKCSTPRCRGYTEIISVGKPLCWKCWKKKCDDEEQEWNRQHGLT